MNIGSSMKVSQRLSLGFGLAIMALIIISAIAIQGVMHLRDALNMIVDVNNPEASAANRMVDAAQEIRIQYRQLLIEVTPENKAKALDRLNAGQEKYFKAESELNKLFEKYAALTSPKERELLSQISSQRNIAFASVQKLLELDKKGDSVRDETVRQLNESTSPSMGKLNTILRELAAEEEKLTNTAATEVKNNADTLRNTVIATSVIAILILLIIAWSITRSILNALGGDPNEVKQIVEKVAEGDFTVNIPLKANDQSSLLYGFSGMVKRLSGVLGEVNYMANNLFSASEQLASTATELSTGAVQQAASVEQTSASVEEMSATVNQNTDNAKIADGIASKTAGSATETGNAVDNMVHAMKEIAGRITMINDIANKTDLLAINAAIEAARAGEHGKGFATVAVEVRKLAERSQVAAREIGDLATRSVGIAEKAGGQLSEMLPGINQTATLVQEIAAGSREQTTGIRQINQAMTQISTTMQTAASSAEELSATAEEVSASAGQLQELMRQFTLNNSGQNSKAPRAMTRSGPRPTLMATQTAADDADNSDIDHKKFSRF
jgi:methyl-accepting chemotaxis protein